MKSRFSHRQIHLLSSLTFPQYLERVGAQLSLPDDFPDDKFAQDWNDSVKVKRGTDLKSRRQLVASITSHSSCLFSVFRLCVKTNRWRTFYRDTSTPAKTSVQCTCCWYHTPHFYCYKPHLPFSLRLINASIQGVKYPVSFFSLCFCCPDVVSESRVCSQTCHQTCRPAGGQQDVFCRRQG